MDLSQLKYTAIVSAIEAGIRILDFYPITEDINLKNDGSPLTKADLASNNIILEGLIKTNLPIISEESKQLEYRQRKNWKDYWLVDPLDGTKEFISGNGEFTVNIALCINGKPEFGIIYVPVSQELYYGEASNQKAYMTKINGALQSGQFFNEEDRIFPNLDKSGTIKIVGSRSHMNTVTKEYIDSMKQQSESIEIVSKGSSLKFCLLAEGKADIYPRFAPTMEWDTAAGHAICKAVGLNVINRNTEEELEYNKESLLNPHFIVS